jgi:hypothetical protein
MMLYVFRLEGSKRKDQLPEAGRAFLWRDIQRGLLHQGWGPPGMSLLKPDGTVMSQLECLDIGRARKKEDGLKRIAPRKRLIYDIRFSLTCSI